MSTTESTITIATTNSITQPPPTGGGTNVVLSKQRWLILLATAVLGFSVAMIGETASILHLLLKLLKLDEKSYIYINQSLYYTTAVLALPTAWFIDKYGIRLGMCLASLLFVINGLLKAILYSPDGSNYKMYFFVASGLLGGEVSSIFFLLPLKISETWFPESERSFAWSLMLAQLSLSSCISSFLYPRIMQQLPDLRILMYLSLIMPLVSAVIVLSCVTRSAPQHPPSERVAKSTRSKAPILVSLKGMLTSSEIMIHQLHVAVFESVTLSMGAVLQDIFTSIGHTEIFAGGFMSANGLVSLIMMIILATQVHKFNNITLVCKVSSLVQGMLVTVYIIALMLKLPGWAIIVISLIMTVARSWVSPNFNNMTAQLACGIVSQATIAGFSMFLIVIIVTVVQVIFASLIIQVGSRQYNYSHALLFLAIVCCLNEAIYLLCFKGPPKQIDDNEQLVTSEIVDD